MKKLIPALILFISACSMSKLDRFPGNAINQFPQELQGTYRLHAGGLKGLFQGRQLDSARLRVSGDQIESFGERGWEVEFRIDSASVLSQYQTLYFVSRKDASQPDYWNSSFIWGDGKSLYFASVNATNRNLKQDKLKNYLRLILAVRNEKQTMTREVLPSESALLERLSNLPADDKDSVLYYRMNEERLAAFFKSEISSKNSIQFNKIEKQ